MFSHSAVGAVDEPRLAESTAADTPAQNLDYGAVVDYLGERHDEIIRRVYLVEVLYNALPDLCGGAVLRCYRLYGAVLVVVHVVQRRNVYSLDLGGAAQEFLPGRAFLLADLHQAHQLEVHLLALADGEKVEEIHQRLRITYAGTACHHDGSQTLALGGEHRNSCQVEHFQHVGVAHFILKRKSDEIEVLYRVEAFQRVQRDIPGAHLLLHIGERHEYSLAPVVRDCVFQTVKYLHAQVGHSDLVGVREAEREPDVDLRLVLDDRAGLAADVPRRLLNIEQELVEPLHH